MTYKKAIKDTIGLLAFPLYKKIIEREMRERFQSFGVESSNICNARCSFCAYRKNLDTREKGFVTFDVLKHALDLYQKTGGIYFSFTSILGDPLTDKELLEKVKLIKSYNNIQRITIYTNLIGLDNYCVEDFVRSGLTDISVSTSIGDKEMFRRLYGVYSYDTVMNNLVSLLEKNQEFNKPINITLLLKIDYNLAANIESIKDYKILNKYLSVKDIKVIRMDAWDDFNGSIESKDLPAGAIFMPIVANKRVPCCAFYRKLQVLKNGDISACSCRISPELVVDNIFNYRFLEDYWKGEKLRQLRQNWLDGNIPKICQGCSHYLPYTYLIRTVFKNRLNLKNIKKLFCK